MHELPLKEWVVIFYPQTGAARLCPTLDFARNTLSSDASFYKDVYKSANDFRVRFDHNALENCWKKLHKHSAWAIPKTAIGKLDDYSSEPPDVDTETFAKMFWEFIQDVGDRLSVPRLVADVKTKENYEIKLTKMAELIGDEKAFKEQYNNQARVVFRALYENGEQFLTEEIIKQLIYRLVADRKLKTKQKPWVIFQYYRPQLIKDGFVVRGRAPK